MFDSPGPPDSGIAFVYPDMPYYEWTSTGDPCSAQVSLDKIITTLSSGNFHGMLGNYYLRHTYFFWIYSRAITDLIAITHWTGFSQGAAVATRVLQVLSQRATDSNPDPTISTADPLVCARILSSLQCVVLIGGVPPPPGDLPTGTEPLSISSLHIIGEKDPYLERLYKLTHWYTENTRTVITHAEDHRVPTMATQIYPSIYNWLNGHII